MAGKPWYRDGLQFECTECGDCCTGAPGYVWVNDEEIAALAKRLNLPDDQFRLRFVRKVGNQLSLVEYNTGDCVFFDTVNRNCSVYEDRPRQCKTWPFWDSNIKTPRDWAQTCKHCPGSGQGTLVPLEEIQRRAAQIKL